jgi:hypothetical protein
VLRLGAAELRDGHFGEQALGRAFPICKVMCNSIFHKQTRSELRTSGALVEKHLRSKAVNTAKMVKQNTSIQSFFPLQTSPLKGLPRTSSPVPGDGFTSNELDTTLVLAPRDDWTPTKDYDEYEIDSLAPGPQRIKIIGRVVNLFESSPKAKLPTGAKGSLHVVIKDNTDAVTVSSCSFSLQKSVLSWSKVRLSYTLISYGLRIGQLVAVWATYVANGDRGIFPCAVAPLYIKIFPEKDKSCHIRLLDGAETVQLCRKPLNYEPTLMSLKEFAQGGFEVTDAKVLVIVKSISTRKKGQRYHNIEPMQSWRETVTRKDGTTAELVKVGVMDDTSEAILSLWGVTSTSPIGWQPSKTALLITSPSLNVSHQNWLALTSNTFIDVDPSIPEAERLREFAGQMVKRRHINPAFPDRGE